MTMNDPISDMLTRLRNGQQAGKTTVQVPASGVKRSILQVLKQEGYILDVEDSQDAAGHPELTVTLKYHQNKPVIETVKRTSRPGLRQYSGAQSIPKVANGLGVTVVSTSHGVMTDTKAREMNVGGELLCQVF